MNAFLPVTLVCTIILFGCSAPKPSDFPKSWKPLNEFPDKTTAISLSKIHTYQVSLLDTTVKKLLERWAIEAKMPLLYDHSEDFTLYKQVKNIKATSIKDALLELSNLYAEQNMIFYIKDSVIIAQQKNNITTRTNKHNIETK